MTHDQLIAEKKKEVAIEAQQGEVEQAGTEARPRAGTGPRARAGVGAGPGVEVEVGVRVREKEEDEEEKGEPESQFQRIFTTLADTCSTPRRAVLLLSMSLALVAPLTYKASQLDYPKTEAFQLFKDDDPYARYFKYEDLFFSTNADRKNNKWCVPNPNPDLVPNLAS